jgi:hypothetical protein
VFVILAVASAGSARAELGGLLSIDKAALAPLELSSYSWERGDWGPGGRGNKFIQFGRVGVPDKGPGVLAVATPVAMADNPLRPLCGKGVHLDEVTFKSPDIDDPTRQNYEIFTLKDVTVSDCVHADGAPAEMFSLNFAEVTELTPRHPTCVFGRDC